jgi:hypothetical protein
MPEEPNDVPSDGVGPLNGLTGFFCNKQMMTRWMTRTRRLPMIIVTPSISLRYSIAMGDNKYGDLDLSLVILFPNDRLARKVKKARQSEKFKVEWQKPNTIRRAHIVVHQLIPRMS